MIGSHKMLENGKMTKSHANNKRIDLHFYTTKFVSTCYHY